MKSKEEIETRLAEIQAQYNQLTEWHDKAYQKYTDDRRWWGRDADRGEVDYTTDLLSECYNEIKILKWVLNIVD